MYLLDTHVLICWLTADKRLSPKAAAAIRGRKNLLYWSTASSWEISIKYALGRLELDEPLEFLIPSELAKNQIEIMPIENEQAILAGQLPLYHKDPFDRMLIAQAQLESLGIITDDSKFKLYDVDIYW
ncbi:MAG TPA: type II toxin-antitoxin system VapC family toxin [Desulfosalsimonadaceae bacterium]|nr:type II toxin-antitoxin system VapC family toxin [Desulfosalsimonadaceae bacterium]